MAKGYTSDAANPVIPPSRVEAAIAAYGAAVAQYRDHYLALDAIEGVIVDPTKQELDDVIWYSSDSVDDLVRVYTIARDGTLLELSASQRAVDITTEFLCSKCGQTSLNALYRGDGWRLRFQPQIHTAPAELLTPLEVAATDAVCPSCSTDGLEDTLSADAWCSVHIHLSVILIPDSAHDAVQKWIDDNLKPPDPGVIATPLETPHAA